MRKDMVLSGLVGVFLLVSLHLDARQTTKRGVPDCHRCERGKAWLNFKLRWRRPDRCTSARTTTHTTLGFVWNAMFELTLIMGFGRKK